MQSTGCENRLRARATWDTIAAFIDHNNNHHTLRSPWISSLARNSTLWLPPLRVFDVGCGTGL
jgi:2-polyprenyl-3-methyl-5-hydroxy-6-metoxy-1,4-benzoquinol methylase